MSKIPAPEEAFEILKQYNKEPFHLKHGQVVSGILGYLAKEHDPERIDFWKTAGMLHDIDYELYPEEHCQKGVELMREQDLDESLIHAMQAHGYSLCSDVEPNCRMEKFLFAVDELSGLIGAAALMRPSKSIDDMDVKSLKKKFKDKRFAAGCNRDVILKGAEMLEMPIEELLEITLNAMKSLNPEMGL
ncbi:MAG: hydrolase [Lachnospiraceae bacterium]|nr:hydrolase [Lachnospiraceae bacterium]